MHSLICEQNGLRWKNSLEKLVTQLKVRSILCVITNQFLTTIPKTLEKMNKPFLKVFRSEELHSNSVVNLSWIDQIKDENADFDIENSLRQMTYLKDAAANLPFEQRRMMAAEVAVR